jgi:hypothetical protein
MKKLTIIIIFIILIIAAGVGLVAYSRMVKKGGAVPSNSSTTTNQVPNAGFPGISSVGMTPSPIPTVAQIPLSITSPTNNSSVTTSILIIKGVTSPKADVFVNDSEVTADTQGNFTVQVTLDEGENTLVVTSNDESGNYSEKDLTVTYNAVQ